MKSAPSLATAAATLLILMLAGNAIACSSSDKAEGPEIRVDPRIELLSIIFRLAGNPEYSRGEVRSYVEDVEAHFGPFREHAVVEWPKNCVPPEA